MTENEIFEMCNNVINSREKRLAQIIDEIEKVMQISGVSHLTTCEKYEIMAQTFMKIYDIATGNPVE